MDQTILVAGATGNLGGKIVKSLLKKGATVNAVVRAETNPKKIDVLEAMGVKVFKIDLTDKNALVTVCKGVNCVVSALSGLEETIIDTQKILLDAAVEAGVPRFIPSDYSIDFTNLQAGQNRNLDLRRRFHQYMDQSPIQSTTIFNGVFMDLLTGEMPLILFKIKRVLYWGKPHVKMDMTTTFNVADFTACVALDKNAPRFLHVAGDSVTAAELVDVMKDATGDQYKLLRAGGIALLNIIIKITKAVTPHSDELYPVWQGMQYLRDMMEGRAVINAHNNDRYADVEWTTVKDFIQSHKSNQ